MSPRREKVVAVLLVLLGVVASLVSAALGREYQVTSLNRRITELEARVGMADEVMADQLGVFGISCELGDAGDAQLRWFARYTGGWVAKDVSVPAELCTRKDWKSIHAIVWAETTRQ